MDSRKLSCKSRWQMVTFTFVIFVRISLFWGARYFLWCKDSILQDLVLFSATAVYVHEKSTLIFSLSTLGSSNKVIRSRQIIVHTAHPCMLCNPPYILLLARASSRAPSLDLQTRWPLYLDRHPILCPKAVSRLLHSPGRVPKSSPEHPPPLPARLPVVQARQVAPAR